MAKSFSDLADDIKRLNEQLQRLGAGGINSNKLEELLKNMNQDIDQATFLFENLNERVDRIAYSFDNISETLKNTLKDLKGQVEATKQIQQSYYKLSSIADKLKNHQKNEYNLSVNKLKILKEEAEEEIEHLKRARQQLALKKRTVGLSSKEKEYYKEINQALNLKNSYLKQTLKHIDREIKLEKNRANNLGLTQGMFKGIHGLMKKIGVESEAFDRINKSMREAAGKGGVFKTAMTGVKATASEMKDSFFNISTSLGIIAGTFKFIKDIAFGFGDSAFQIQQGLGTSWQEAQRLNEQLFAASTSTSDLYSTHSDLVKAQIGLNSAMGTYDAYGIRALDNFTKLQEVAGLTGEEAAKLQEYGDLYGKSSEEIYDTIGQTKKGLLSNKHVLSQVLKVGGQLSAQYKNNPDLLAKAVVQSNKMGISLEQAKNAASSLLDFESSIQNELEAELLTGKNLNLEQARYKALMGDSAGAAEEMLKQVGGIDSYNKMNVIQQEAIAKSMGMNTDELATALVKQKQYSNLQKGQADALKKRVAELKAAGEIEKANELERQGLEGKSVELAEQELDAKRKAEKSMERAKEQFMKAIAPVAIKVANLLADVMDYISKSPIMKSVIKAVGAGLAIGAVVASLVSVGNIIAKVFGGGGGLKSLFGKRGSSRGNPLFVKEIGGGLGGSPLDSLGGGKGKWGGAGMKLFKGLSKLFGGKSTSLGRAMRNTAAWMGKPGGTLSKIWSGTKGQLGTAGTSGLRSIFGLAPEAASSASTASKGSSFLSKATSLGSKALKVLGPLGAITELATSTFSGTQAGNMTKEEQKAAGIRQGMGSTEGGIAAFLTGGAEKGSSMSEFFGIEKDTGADEAMGVGGAALRGAAIGAMFGPIGAAVGAGVGGIAEGVKLLVNEDSQLRKTLDGWGESFSNWASDTGSAISNFASSSWDTLKGWGSEAGSAISDFASSSWDTLKGWGSEAGSAISDFASSSWGKFKGWGGNLMDSFSGIFSGIGNMASNTWNGMKSIGGGIIDSISSGISSTGDYISSGISAVGDFLGFAEGGIVSGPTRALIGEGSSSEAVVPLDKFYAKLDQVITAINNMQGGGGGDVYLDSRKVGQVINMNTRGIQ